MMNHFRSLFGRIVCWQWMLAALLAGCGGDSVSSHDEPNSSGLQSSAGESSSSSVENDESSSSVLSVSSAEESSSSMEEGSSSSEISSSESSSSENSSSSSSGEHSSSSSVLPESSSSLNVVFGEMVDERDGQVYRTITIDGKATWMAENLNYAYLQPTSTLDSSSWCYENEPDSCAKYGRLYLWSAAMDSAGLFSPDTKGCGYYAEKENWYECHHNYARGVCPEHWHVATRGEIELPLQFPYYDGTYYTNQLIHGYGYGFDILYAGFYDSKEDFFEEEGYGAYLWLATEYSYSAAIYAEFPDLAAMGNGDPRGAWSKDMAFSIRCVKDKEVEE
ncbi:FISUMP domain-containing protein [uncultured Fibrobacter sp.]|uniref:FISUMP domain-containing protein n=1 Tax=uncultured Fibrobacter sp. TaxID=261512 RepID=UPI002628A7EE|nr:FISUMP domain-containing protein [uncultured Fibrobacter sp.]